VLNCCVTETKEAPLVSRISTILAKSASERFVPGQDPVGKWPRDVLPWRCFFFGS